ncbi:MAG: MOSC N-terminal beta barrel domain-containing protein [Saprospiraceae bacterium]
MYLSEIWVYPIKSLGGIALPAARVQRRGLQYDRRWMLVDPAGRFVSQREIPDMALLGTAVEAPWLVVFSKTDPAQGIRIPLELPVESLEKVMVEVWSARCAARLMPAEINQWFSGLLGQELRLVWMPDTTRRAADGRYAPKGQYVSFADGFPFLILGQATLDDLNQRLAQPLPMNRFRPNLVFSGGPAFDEDDWQEFHIGQVPFKNVKPCARCIITTIDQETALRAQEPLRTLATFRRRNNKIYFGQNAVWLGTEEPEQVRVGDPIIVANRQSIVAG